MSRLLLPTRSGPLILGSGRPSAAPPPTQPTDIAAVGWEGVGTALVAEFASECYPLPLIVEYSVDGGAWTESNHALASYGGPAPWRCRIEGLTADTTYSIRIRVTNELGTSPESAAVNLTTAGTPGLITDMVVTVLSAVPPLQVSVAFTHADTGNCPIGNYRVDVNGLGNHGAVPAQTSSPVIITDDGGNRNLVSGDNTLSMACYNVGGFNGPYNSLIHFTI